MHSPLFTVLLLATAAASAIGVRVSDENGHRVTPGYVPITTSRADTVDVALGSSVLDTKGMRPFSTHLQVHRVTEGKDDVQQEATNTISLGDSAGTPVVRVSSVGHVQTPKGMVSNNVYYTFDRGTLALRSMRNVSPRGDMVVKVAGNTIDLSMPTPGGPRAISLQLSAPAYYAQWSDFVVEELPKREGVVYRARMWRPAPPASPGAAPQLAEETHLYSVVGREDITVFGKPISKAWIVEDRVVGQAGLAGRMWIVDEAPKLVRWTIYGDPGVETRIDQELAGRE